MLDYPRSRIGGPKKHRKFCINRLTILDMWISHIRRLCFKFHISVHFGRFLWGVDP